MKKIYYKNLVQGRKFESNFMIKKILFQDETGTTAIVGDKTGDFKVNLKEPGVKISTGEVITVKGNFSSTMNIEKIIKVQYFDLEDYLQSVERPIEDIMRDLEVISEREFKSLEAKALDDYFFKNPQFLDKFKRGIGGVSYHHNYLGGLAEHTLNVTKLAIEFTNLYNSRYREIAILSAKLHDIGKTEELYYDGPFNYTLRGEMEGHIVIGVSMLEEAFNANKNLYSYDFKERVKGCIVQHHGKLEYGSPRTPKTEEAYIVHLADHVDAMLNKLNIIKDDVERGEWTPFDKRIDGKIYV